MSTEEISVLGEPTKHVSKAKLKITPADPTEILKKKIISAHADSITSMVDSVRHAAECGSLLIESRETLKDPFRVWISTALPFTYRTAYRYMQISEAVTDGAISLDGVSSINEALKLLSRATKAKEEEKTEEKEEKDERIETFVTAAMKIESWFKKETSKSPLSAWGQDRKKAVRTQLDGVVQIYEALNG